MSPGVDFVNSLQRRLANCDVLVAVIGKAWLSAADPDGKARLAKQEDYVRLEVATALSRGKVVLPVLVGNAQMPRALDLPGALELLTRKNALEIRFNTFEIDVGRLIAAIENQLSVGASTPNLAATSHVESGVSLPQIDDVDQTLRRLLLLELPHIFSVVAITFSPPDKNFPPPSVSLPAIDIFLTGVQQNQSATDWETSAFTVEHSYLITAWANEFTPNPAGDEHRLLSQVAEVFARYPLIPGRALCGGLKAKSSPFSAVSIKRSDRQDILPLWQSLGRTARASLTYTVTIGIQTRENAMVARTSRRKRSRR